MLYAKAMNKKMFLFLSYFVIALACILRVVTYYSHHYYVVPDEAHSLAGMRESFLYLFTHFEQGANFLPLYKTILKLIYDTVGFTIPYLKIPSLIAGIASVFVFFDIAKKVFKNEIIILCSLILFSLNYNLIYYSSQIKPYEIDVLLCLIIINFAISFKDKIITNKNLVVMSLFSCLFIYTSIPAVVILQLCIVFLFIFNKENRKKIAILEAIVLFVLGVEYFTYISQIQSDSSLKSMWTEDDFFFTPKSLPAVNALFNFSFLNFFWWDSHCPLTFSRTFLISYLMVFFVGIINFLREKQYGLILVSPVFFFLILSYLNIYPFCNRLIIFLIPIFILITLKAFEYNYKKYIGIFFAIVLTISFVFLIKKHEFYKYLITFDKEHYQQLTDNVLPLNNIGDDELIISTGSPYWFCLKNKNVYINQEVYLLEDIDLQNKKKVYFAYNLVDDTQENVDKFVELLIKKGYRKSYLFDKEIHLSYIVFEKNN